MENYNQNVKILRWVARIMAMSFAAFISIFALDVFSGTNSFWESVFVFFLHLIPTFLIILVIIISWHKEWIAGFAFLLFGLLHIVTKWGELAWVGYVLISVPLFVLGLLFFIVWEKEKGNRPLKS